MVNYILAISHNTDLAAQHYTQDYQEMVLFWLREVKQKSELSSKGKFIDFVPLEELAGEGSVINEPTKFIFCLF